jgi:TatD DNase family protein
MRLFDVHTHTQFQAFKDDWKETIKHALYENVWLINVGTQKDTSARAVEIANQYKEGVYSTAGLHPIHTEKSYHDPQELGGEKGFESREENLDYEYYKNLAKDPKVVAIGECGLDYYRLSEDTKKRQKEVFERQIQLASEVKKPLMIHCRQAFTDLISILNINYKILNTPPGVVHFFSGTKEDSAKLMDLDFSFSFGGVITFAREYEKLIKYLPLKRILLETDAPYVAPIPYRGERNEPSYVLEVAKKIATVKKISVEEVAEVTFTNAQRIFLEKGLKKS